MPLDVRRPFLALIAAFSLCARAEATPAITMDAATGDVLYQQDATQTWFPASTTKLMTVWVALQAVRAGKISMDTPLVYSTRAQRMPPSKMGFRPGTQVTLGNALKMLMVRSANDIAITIAEGVSGSVEAFADDMNQAAADLGLHESHFVNPNGLPNPEHVSSARDMALIARALYTSFPEQAPLFDIGELSMGSQIIGNHNNLLGRYPGADGMKTGFTCAAGFNVVASAYRDGRRIVTVVFGAPSVATRTAKAAALFDRAFANIDRPIASIVAMGPGPGGGAPDMRDRVCRSRSALIAQFNAEVDQLDAPLMPSPVAGLGLSALNPERALLFSGQSAPPSVSLSQPTALTIASMPAPVFDPVPVHVGAEPGYQGPVAQARAPHSPIGSEPVPATVSAYAATPATGPIEGIGVAPIGIDANALPLRGRRVKTVHGKRGRAGAMKAAAEAPKTKVIAGAEDGAETPAAEESKAKPGKAPTKRAAKGKTTAKKQAMGDGDDGAKKKPAPAKKAAAKPAPAKKTAAKPAKSKTAGAQ